MSGRLARRIVIYVILTSTLFSIMTSGIQIYAEYQRDISGVHAGLDQIEKTHLSNISSRVWVLDIDELKTTLDSLLSLPAIHYIAVYEDQNLLMSAGTDTDQNIITKRYPLIHTLNKTHIPIGNLVVKASLDEVYQHIIDRAIVIVASNTVKTFIVSFLLLFIFYRLVTRHLSSISEFSQQHNPLLNHTQLTLDRTSKKPDEIDTVVESINEMHLRLNQQVAEINHQKQYLSQTLNSIGDAVITTDIQGNIERMNPVAVQLTGWPSEEAQKQSLKTVFPIINATTRVAIDNPIDKVISTGETVYLSNHTTLISRQGAEYQIADSAAPIRDDEGKILGMVLVFNDITEQYRLRETAAKSRRNLQAIMDYSPTMIYLKDKNGQFIFLNQQFETHFPTNNDDIIGKTALDILPKDIADEMQRCDDKVWATGHSLESEELVPHKDGLHTYFTVRFPLLNDDGKAYAICGISNDITEKKRDDETVRKIANGITSQIGEAFFQSLTKNLAEIFSAEFTFIGLLDEHNPKQVNTVSLCIDGEIVDNLSFDLEHTPCNEVVCDTCDSIQSYSSNVQQLFPKDDMLLEMAAESYVGAPLVGSNGKPIGLIVVMDNKPMENTKRVGTILQIFATRATAELERMQAEEALRLNEKKFQTLATVAPVGIFYADEQSNCSYVNEKWSEITGVTAVDAMGNGWMAGLHMDDRELVISEWNKAAKRKLPFKLEYRFQHPDGIRWVLGQALAEEGDDGEVIGYVGTITDITERKETEYALRRSQKMDALGQLTGGIAHDYNNMLGVVLGYAELLHAKLNAQEQPDLVKYVKEINRAGQRSAKLTEKLLAFSRHKTSSTELININTVLLDEQHMLEKTLTARIKLVLDLAENLWSVRLDENDLEDAILNISINAMHAVEGNGQLTIQTSNQHIDRSSAQQLHMNAGDYVLLAITDTGCGMDEQTKEKIFDPFFSTKGDTGTGLGLSQVYGFVERSSGIIKVYSEPEQGTQLKIYFPRQIEDQDDKQVANTTSASHFKGKESILVVDDEPALLDLTCEILSQNGYQVFSAANARQALEILEKEAIDLMISDVIMLEMDGYELATIVQHKYPDTKIQLASGYNDIQQLNEVDDSLRNALLSKPYTLKILLQRIKDILS